ncbi:beta-lactamase hydrolase domain-containing protein [Paludisphaera borealis]|uniref:Beta-lactamase hydrolase-like protein n=1 Tax=Paludisphaera borealis TaxID=1387353 RepID=A0A1U7CPD2_9BACT|nr:sulfur transferase domain-containing protein [Paludisphaera borealis]APW60792.1 Beta-lactamase hydrolase-like protein [Paludisphaera borealis]MDR3622561.1 sulfur transferase domain-containing protein [Paludisphaera borealis]
MNVKRAITDRITIADQPEASDLADLKKEGYVGVVNLRNDGEPEQPLSVDEEGTKVRALDMAYLHFGVGSAPLADPGVVEVCDFIDRLTDEGKVLVHCRKGGRAAALVLLQQARAGGWKADEALAKGEAEGLRLDGGLKTKVEDYLRSKS